MSQICHKFRNRNNFPKIVYDCNKEGFAGFHHSGFGAALFISQCNNYKKLNQTLQYIFCTATKKDCIKLTSKTILTLHNAY